MVLAAGLLILFIIGLLVFLIIRLFQRKPVGTIVRGIVAIILLYFGLSSWYLTVIFMEGVAIGFFMGLVPISIGLCIFFIPLHRSRAEKRKPLEEIQQQQQEQVDDQVDTVVERLYERYGEEWINNAGRSRLSMAIDEMLGPSPRRNSNAARAQRTLAAAVLETVLARKIETARQQQDTRQSGSSEGAQMGIVADPTLAADVATTMVDLTANAEHIDDLNDVDDLDDLDADDLDDVDDVDLDVD